MNSLTTNNERKDKDAFRKMSELTLVLSGDFTVTSYFSSRREPSCIIHSKPEFLLSMLLLHILPSFFISHR